MALKTKPANWQICDNFALAAAKSGEPHAAARATLKTIELSQGQRVHSEVLELLVDEVEALYGLPRRADGDESLEGSGVGASDADPARCVTSALNVHTAQMFVVLQDSRRSGYLICTITKTTGGSVLVTLLRFFG